MADRAFNYPDRPVLARDEEGRPANPDGWTQTIVAADAETIVAGWDEAGVFWQWEDTETIVRALLSALVQHQAALAEVRG